MEQINTQICYENVFAITRMNEIELNSPQMYEPYIRWIAENYYSYDKQGNYIETEEERKQYFESPENALRTPENDFIGRILYQHNHIEYLIECGFKFKYSKPDYMEQVLKYAYMTIHNMSETSFQDNRFFSNLLIGMNKMYHLCYDEQETPSICWKFQDILNQIKNIVYTDIEDNVYKSLIYEKLRDYVLYCDTPYNQQNEMELERLSLQVLCYVRDYYYVYSENIDDTTNDMYDTYLYNENYRSIWREQVLNMVSPRNELRNMPRIYPNNQDDYNNWMNTQQV